MTLFQRRLIIALDEWLGIALCLYLWKTGDYLFFIVAPLFFIMVYLISYPLYWRHEKKILKYRDFKDDTYK